MEKVSCGFTLKKDNLDWLREVAAVEDRSLSNMLDRLLDRMRQEEKSE